MKRIWMATACVGLLIAGLSSTVVGRVATVSVAARPVKVVDQVGGASYAVALQGHIAFLGVGSRMLIIDVSTPTAPRAVAWTDPLPSLVQSIEVVDNLAFVASSPDNAFLDSASFSSLDIIDVGDLAKPRSVAAIGFPGGIRELDVSEGFAYLASEQDGLRIVDVRDPAHPAVAGELMLGGSSDSVSVSGSFAFVANWAEGLHVIDVSDPDAPSLESRLVMDGSVMKVVANDGWVYVVVENQDTGDTVVHLLDPRNATQVKHVGSIPVDHSVDAIRVVDDRLFMVGSGLITLVDIRDRRQPEIVAGGFWKGLAHDLAVSGPTIVAAADLLPSGEESPAGLRVIVERSGKLLAAGRFDTLRSVGQVALTSDQVWFGAEVINPRLDSVVAMDRLNPLNAGGSIQSSVVGRIWDIGATDGFAALATWKVDVPFAGGGLRIMDLRDPKGPRLAGGLEVNGAAHGVAVLGSHVFLAGGTGLEVIDASDKEHPAIIAHLPLTANAPWSFDMEAVPEVVFVASGDSDFPRNGGTFLAIDVSIPTRPSIVFEELLSMRPECIAIAGDTLYVAGTGGLLVFDITVPTRPRPIASKGSHLSFEDMTIAHDIGYAIVFSEAGNGGPRHLAIIDLRDPSNPMELADMHMPAWPQSIDSADGHIYVGGGDAGLLVLSELEGPLHTPTVTPTKTSTTFPTPTPIAPTEEPMLVPQRIYLPWLTGAARPAGTQRCVSVGPQSCTEAQHRHDMQVGCKGHYCPAIDWGCVRCNVSWFRTSHLIHTHRLSLLLNSSRQTSSSRAPPKTRFRHRRVPPHPMPVCHQCPRPL